MRALSILQALIFMCVGSVWGQTQGNYLKILGANTNDHTGLIMLKCDLNNDGCEDLVLGVPDADQGNVTNVGEVHILFGNKNYGNGDEIDLSLLSSRHFVLRGEMQDERLGSSIAAGDINGDGIDDLLFTTPGLKGDNRKDGGCYVFFGSENFQSNTTITRPQFESEFNSLAIFANFHNNDGDWLRYVTAADLNGDGYDDIIIGGQGGSFYTPGAAGVVYVIFGDLNKGNSSDIDLSVQGNPEYQRIIGMLNVHNISSLDFDGNSYDDFVIQYSAQYNGALSSHALIVYGSDSLAQASQSFYYDYSASSSIFLGGLFQKGIFDINNDQKDDMLVQNDDQLYVVTGRSKTGSDDDIRLDMNPSGVLQVSSDDPTDLFGEASYAALIDNNAKMDFIIGAERSEVGIMTDVGKAYVLYDVEDLLSLNAINIHQQSNTRELNGNFDNEYFGSGVIALDFNGDSINEVAIGAFGAAVLGRVESGAVYVHFSNSSTPELSVTLHDSLDFATSVSGEHQQQLVVTNMGGGSLSGTVSINGNYFVNDSPSDFNITGRDSTRFHIFYRPAIRGIHTGSVTVSSNGGTNTVLLKGNTEHNLTVSINSPTGDTGINKIPDKSKYDYGDSVSITAFADLNTVFRNWVLQNDTVLSNPLNITITQDTVVIANFDIITSVEDNPDIQDINFRLHQNYPNPFNPETTIRFSLRTAENVSLNIFSIHGTLVKSIVSSFLTQGEHNYVWNGTNSSGLQVSSGIYFYVLQAGNLTKLKKMILIK